jgi:FAD-dependent urate hydroxylase
MTGRSAVIVGGGIGGLSAGIALHRAGLDVTVLEQRSELSEVNTGFLLWGFAVTRLREFGIDVDSLGMPLETLVTVGADGHEIDRLDMRSLSHRVGAVTYDVHRARLQRALADALGMEHVQLATSCGTVEVGDTQSAVVTEAGERHTGDLVVGADGIHSVVRRVVQPGARIRRSRFHAFRGLARLGPDVVPEGLHYRMLGDGALFGAGHVGGGEVRWYLAVHDRDRPPAEAAEYKNWLRERVRSWPSAARSTIDATDSESILHNDTPFVRPLRRWTRQHVALLGDAAHGVIPSLAVGGGMAIEDGAVLGRAFTRTQDIRSALEDYETSRRGIAARIQWVSELATALFRVKGRLAERLVDRLLPRAEAFTSARLTAGRL